MFINPFQEPEQNIKKDGYLGSFVTYKSIGSISIKAFHIYKNKYPQLLLISIIPFIPALILSMFYIEETASIIGYFLQSSEVDPVNLSNIPFTVYFLLILQMFLDPLALAAMTIAIGRIIISYDTNNRFNSYSARTIGAYYFALTRGYSLILNVVIFYLVLLFFGFLSLFLIGLPLLLIWILATIVYPHAIYFENSGPGSALLRSIKLLSKSWLDLFKFWIPLIGITGIQFISSTYIVAGSIGIIFNELLSFILQQLVPIITSLAYVHYRIKLDNLSYIDYGNSVLNLGKSIEE